jgi:DNA-binding IscR family transcriptional regulator
MNSCLFLSPLFEKERKTLKQHVRVPYVLLDLNITNGAKKLFIALLYFCGGKSKQIKVTLKKIAERAGLKERQVKNHIRTLCEHHILMRKQISYGECAWGCNTYTILCNETYYAKIPYVIAFNPNLSAHALLTYCTMKRYTNLNKQDYICIVDKRQLAKQMNCTVNHLDKVKRELKQAGYIAYSRQ